MSIQRKKEWERERATCKGHCTHGEHLGHVDGKFADSYIIVKFFIIVFYDIHGILSSKINEDTIRLLMVIFLIHNNI